MRKEFYVTRSLDRDGSVKRLSGLRSKHRRYVLYVRYVIYVVGYGFEASLEKLFLGRRLDDCV